MPPPRLFIHCGLHKTGTTALQRFLLSERDALRDLGIMRTNKAASVSARFELPARIFMLSAI
jgi:hypothetical protein